MTIHTVIIDDESSGVRSLELMLQEFIPEVKIVATCTDPVEGIEVINNYRPDLVFLDINMPGLDGFEMLEQLRYKDFQLVFSTAYQQHALRALKLNACDYLLKPVNLDELKVTLERVKQRLLEKEPAFNALAVVQEFTRLKNMRIPIVTRQNIEYVSPAQIMYIEAFSNYSKITLSSGQSEKVKSALKYYETMLCNNMVCFMRIHNSFIINIDFVKRYLKENGGCVIMQDNVAISVSKHKKDEFFRSVNLRLEL